MEVSKGDYKMEELIGRRIKVTLNQTNGMIIVTGELMKVETPFMVMETLQGSIYLSIYQVRTIEVI